MRLLAVVGVLVLLQPTHLVSMACVSLGLRAQAVPAQAVPAETIGEARERASADDCCSKSAGEGTDDERPSEGGEHENCPCPFPCSVGCGGQQRAIVLTTVLPDVVRLPAIVTFASQLQHAPENPDPRGILHVPKLVLT
jgi:hypothetical protein